MCCFPGTQLVKALTSVLLWVKSSWFFSEHFVCFSDLKMLVLRTRCEWGSPWSDIRQSNPDGRRIFVKFSCLKSVQKMRVKLDHQLIPGFLNILEGVVRPDAPWALELGFLQSSHEEIPRLSDLVVDNEEFHFCRLAVLIQSKKALLICGIILGCWSARWYILLILWNYSGTLICLGRAVRKSLQRPCDCDNIFSDLWAISPTAPACEALLRLCDKDGNALNNKKLFMWSDYHKCSLQSLP